MTLEHLVEGVWHRKFRRRNFDRYGRQFTFEAHSLIFSSHSKGQLNHIDLPKHMVQLAICLSNDADPTRVAKSEKRAVAGDDDKGEHLEMLCGSCR